LLCECSEFWSSGNPAQVKIHINCQSEAPNYRAANGRSRSSGNSKKGRNVKEKEPAKEEQKTEIAPSCLDMKNLTCEQSPTILDGFSSEINFSNLRRRTESKKYVILGKN
jgi:hypothetical protein